MEARELSQCGTLRSWNVFKVIGSEIRHIVGYSPNYQIDIITDEIVRLEYDKKSKTGKAITRAGILYELAGKPIRITTKYHAGLTEFMHHNDCQIRFVRL